MKIIDLFKLEVKPKTINYRGFVYIWDDMRENYVVKCYEDAENTCDSDDIFFLANYNLFKVINDEIEIIEEVEDKEYEDIDIINGDYVVPNTPATENEAYIMACFLAHEQILNALIRNQKYILEVLNDNNKNNR